MRNPICLFRGLWRSLRCWRLMSGHEFRTASAPTPDNVHVLVCHTCGFVSTGWSWDSLERVK